MSQRYLETKELTTVSSIGGLEMVSVRMDRPEALGSPTTKRLELSSAIQRRCKLVNYPIYAVASGFREAEAGRGRDGTGDPQGGLT